MQGFLRTIIRRKSKQGQYTQKEDSLFCLSMFKKYPEWYNKTESKIFNDTVPFGSEARRPEDELPPYSEWVKV